jgi:GTPase
MIKKIRVFFNKLFFNLFKKKSTIKLGFYGPVNAGKSSLANRISKDFTGEEMSSVSKVPHETREVIQKEKVRIKYDDKEMDFNLIDTPGIATRVDYEDFLKHKMKPEEAKARAKEATQGVIESIKWLDSVDCVLVVLDAAQDPYSQVNITIIGNLAARKVPILIVANKIDLKKANIEKIKNAFPQYPVVGVSALKGKHMDEFYEEVFKLIK